MQTLTLKAIACFMILFFSVQPGRSEHKFLDKLSSYDGKESPQLVFRDLEGNQHKLKDFEGKFLVVNFWATWCHSCVREMPSLSHLSASFKDKPIQVLTIAFLGNEPDLIKRFFEKHEITDLTAYRDENSKLAKAFEVRGLPTTVFIDKKGLEIARVEGSVDWNDPDVKDWIEKNG
jgi:thiol-disulfide isomerase/thioredoxin